MKKTFNLCKAYYSVTEAAFLFGKSVKEIRRSIKAGKLEAKRRGTRGNFRIPSHQIFKDVKKIVDEVV